MQTARSTTSYLIVLAAVLVAFSALSADANKDLLKAAKRGKLDQVKALLKKGVDVNARETSISNRGWTPLHFAAFGGHAKDVVQL